MTQDLSRLCGLTDAQIKHYTKEIKAEEGDEACATFVADTQAEITPFDNTHCRVKTVYRKAFVYVREDIEMKPTCRISRKSLKQTSA